MGYTVTGVMNNGTAAQVKSLLGCHGDAGAVENMQVSVGAYTPALEFSCYLARTGQVPSSIQAPVFFLRYDATHSGAVRPVDWAADAASHFGTEDGVSSTGSPVTYHAAALSGYPYMVISSDPAQIEAVNEVLAQF